MGAATKERDLRLDFFRGMALVVIFIDHVPGNKLAWLTIGSWNFFDAAEMFVFISGYTAALVFGGAQQRLGYGLAALRVLGRCWVLYVAHVFLFVIFMAEVSLTAQSLANPMFLEEMRVDEFLRTPHLAVFNALTLTFQPAFMDILPLYIVLMLGLAVALPFIARWPWPTIGASFALYLVAQRHWFNLSTYPDGTWFFNPAAWQLVFVVGACLGYPRAEPWRPWRRVASDRIMAWICLGLAGVFIAGKLFLTLQAVLGFALPHGARFLWWGGGKTSMGAYRLVNFFAVAYLIAYLVDPAAAWLRRAAAAPVIHMGQNSLYVFCLSIFLSYLAHLVLVEVSSRTLAHLAVSAVGVGVMAAVAAAMNWVGRAEARRSPRKSMSTG